MQVFNREHYEHVRISNDIARIAGYSKAKVASVIVKSVLRIALFPLSIVLMLAMVILRIVLIIGCWIAKGFGTACAYLEDVFEFWQTLFGLGYTFGNNPFRHIYGQTVDIRFFLWSRKRRNEHLRFILRRETVPEDMWPASLKTLNLENNDATV